MTTTNRRFTPEQLARLHRKMADERRRLEHSKGVLYHFSRLVEVDLDPALDSGSKLVFAAVVRLANFEDSEVQIDRSAIAMLTGLTQRSVTNKLSILRNHGYLNYFRVSLGQGHGTASVYQVAGMTEEEIENYTSAMEDIYGLHGLQESPDASHPNSDLKDGNPQKAPNGSHGESDITKLENTDTVTSIRVKSLRECPPSAKVTKAPNGSHGESDITKLENTDTVTSIRVKSLRECPPSANVTEGVTCKSQCHSDSDLQPSPNPPLSLIDSKKLDNKKESNTQTQKDTIPEKIDEVFDPEKVDEAFERFWSAYPHYNSRSTKQLSRLYFADLVAGKLTCHEKRNPRNSWEATSVDPELLVQAAEFFRQQIDRKPEAACEVAASDRWLKWGRYENAIDLMKRRKLKTEKIPSVHMDWDDEDA